MLTTPLDRMHRAAGAKMMEFAGYDMPVQYEGILSEHRHVRTAAGLFDVSHMGQIVIRDAEAAKKLESLVPSDIQSLEVGAMRYTMFLNKQGGVLDDVIVTRFENEFFLIVNASRKTEDFALLQTIFSAADMVMVQNHALLALQGPKAEEILAHFMPDCHAMTFMTAKRTQINGWPVTVTRSGYTGEDGFEISIATHHAEALATLLLSNDTVKWIGLGARDTLRLEAGLCLYGHDLDETTTPVEAALGWTIGKSRREVFDFAGGSIVREQLQNKPKRKRVGLSIEGRAPAREGTVITDNNGKDIGIVTSGTFSPTLNAPIAMGYVAQEFSALATKLQLNIRGALHPARVCALPFVPHHYKKI